MSDEPGGSVQWPNFTEEAWVAEDGTAHLAT